LGGLLLKRAHREEENEKTRARDKQRAPPHLLRRTPLHLPRLRVHCVCAHPAGILAERVTPRP